MFRSQQVEYLRDLNQLALGVASMAKEAAYNIGGTQVMPTPGYANGSGFYDPDDSRAYSSQLALRRGDIAAAQIDNGRTHMVDLLPYRGILNEGYGVISQNLSKTASLEDAAYDWDEYDYEDYVDEMLSTGLFDDIGEVPEPEVYAFMINEAMEKSASVSDEQISDMLEYGVFENIDCPEYIDELMEADEELDYYFDDEDYYD